MSIRAKRGQVHFSGTARSVLRTKWTCPLFTALLLLMPAAARAEIAAELTPETASLFIYEPFTLRLEVESDAAVETPQLPAVPDLAVTTVRRLASDPAQRKHVFQIEMIAGRKGILTVPPFAVRARGETTLTSALRLRIGEPRSTTEMTLEVTVEPAALRVGQPATVTVTWTSAVSFARCKQLLFTIPLLADKRCHVFPLDPPPPQSGRTQSGRTQSGRTQSKGIGLPVNNVRVVAQADTLPPSQGRRSLSFRYKLVPREPCVLRARPARLRCALLAEERTAGEPPSHFYNHFFEAPGKSEAFEKVYLAAAVPEITVRALAETGRNAHFAGIVGPCELRTSVAPARMTVGHPALFTVHLDNLALARHITGLPSAAFDGLRAEFQLSREPIRQNATDPSIGGSARSFTHILRPLRSGITRIPAIVIQTFDPESGKFHTLRSEPIPITVEAAQDDGSLAFTPRLDSASPIRLHGVRHNRLSEWTMISTHNLLEFLGRLWWVFVPLPALVWLALLPLMRRWERCRRDPAYALAITAWRRFRRTAWRDEESAWRNYLAQRLALRAEALTADSVTEALSGRNVDAGLIAEARGRFEEKDAADYGRRPAAPSQGTRRLVRRLQKATRRLLLVFGCLLPAHATAADRADEMFALAMQMRGEKPDEAQPLFVEAALTFESVERFLNAGNSWFFAGENGRALVNYRAAQRRAPFDGQLRESIEFLRANRADVFPPSASATGKVTGKVAAAWTRYGTWAPLLRVGSFVLAYLTAWAVLLTAQLAGRRVRRAVWVVLLVAVIVPLVSLAQSCLRPAEGVVIEDAVARLGPGYAYDPAFKQPLHKATEFAWLETRQGWVRARLPDASEGWLRESGCMKVE